ncbi:MAG: hypothetical protein WBQ78_09960, partial [Gammaproteobacteria bacterium]
MSQQDNRKIAEDLVNALWLQNMPLAISFTQGPLPGVEPFADDMPAPTADGRICSNLSSCYPDQARQTGTELPCSQCNPGSE